VKSGRARAAIQVEVLLLVGILAAVAVATLSYLKGLDLARREQGALATLARLSAALGAFNPPAGFPLPEPILRHVIDREGALAAEGRFLQEGSWLREGYLFRASPIPAEPGERQRFALVAWPAAHGGSGNAAFVVGPDGECKETRNPRGRYDGPGKGPDPSSTISTDRKGRIAADGEEWIGVRLP